MSSEPVTGLAMLPSDLAPATPEKGRLMPRRLDLALLWFLERFGPDDDEDWGS